MKKLLLFFMILSFTACATVKIPLISKPCKKDPYWWFLKASFDDLSGDYKSSTKEFTKLVNKYPDSAYMQYLLAISLINDRKLDEAIVSCNKSLELDPNLIEAQVLLGKIYYVKGDFSKAAPAFEKALKKEYSDETCILLSKQYIEIKDNSKAIEVVKGCIVKSPDSASLYLVLGSIYSTRLKNYNFARKYLDKALSLDPENAQLLGLLAQIAMEAKDQKGALKYLLQMELADPTDVTIKIKLALIYYDMGDKDKAVEAFKLLLEVNEDADRIRYSLGLLYDEMGKKEEALREYDLIPVKSSYYVETRIRIANYYNTTGEWKKALDVIRESYKKKPDSISLYEFGAAIGEEHEDYKETASILEDGHKALPKDEKILFWLGLIYERMGNRELALQKMKAVLKLNPENPDALNYIGYTYADMGINLDEALELTVQALMLKPDSPYIMDSIAWVYIKMGKLDEATSYLEKAVQKSPDEVVIMGHMGELKYLRGDKAGALEYFKKALAIALTKKVYLNPAERAWIESRIKMLEGE
ncbi:MAG: tetratricopeptide repeat protein [Pseudomonadota bacterium]